jgi:hypothetical protein
LNRQAAELAPIYMRMKELLLGSAKIVVDKTRARFLDPSANLSRTKSQNPGFSLRDAAAPALLGIGPSASTF